MCVPPEPCDVAKIYSCILRSYGSLSEPRWAFVERIKSAEPYKEIIRALKSARFDIRDETSTGSDEVCFKYELSRADANWELLLSMVGPFAVLFKSAPSSWAVVEPAAQTSTEKEIEDILWRSGIRMLGVADLRTHLDFNLSVMGFEPEDVTVYAALFDQFSDDPP